MQRMQPNDFSRQRFMKDGVRMIGGGNVLETGLAAHHISQDDRNASQLGETLVKHHHNCIINTAHETLVKHLERWPNRYIFTIDLNVFCAGIMRHCLVSWRERSGRVFLWHVLLSLV
ncbi:hypothetical protein L873DRAFT_1046535 [Choiromyces venosus 120613-1]|uniref:Uncharacterized protein n=1 Tax=Choiromyces venosus 120613-1 TaxID=1336337 RepID=A0A3N4JN61_9PEZI|nr:hypothetical protein L873DRAFT_1046535 [Choiromyces venosus 120613-1]